MSALHPVLEELVTTGRLTTEQAEAVQEEHRQQGLPVPAVAVEQGFVSETDYLQTVAELLGTEVVRSDTPEISAELRTQVPAALARMHNVLPLEATADSATFAVADLPGPSEMDDISFVLSRTVRYVAAPQALVSEGLAALYGEEDDDPQELLVALEEELEKDTGLAEPADLEHAANTTPVIRFVNLVLYQAVKDQASDIHFEPFENEFRIRYRVDGALYEINPPPVHLALPVISRIKVISGLDIGETRLPQDGRLQLPIAGRSIDFRVSTLPTQFGESVVLRVLDQSSERLDIHSIGLPADLHETFLDDLAKPNGVIIVTGPTGSGKTTTLYAALQHINRAETKILTAEDPVEYDVDGIIQLPVHDAIGLTFASALRSFLRQDPDVIMVGEIRDAETAQIAIQASLTGHLVLSTLHTNDAAGAITRLLDLEVEPYLMASTLEAVMAQRLVRSLCRECRTVAKPTATDLQLFGLTADTDKGSFYHPAGCPACHQTGYLGRHALFEYLPISDALRSGMLERQPTHILRQIGRESGMRTLREDGLRHILTGDTSIEEVVQYT